MNLCTIGAWLRNRHLFVSRPARWFAHCSPEPLSICSPPRATTTRRSTRSPRQRVSPGGPVQLLPQQGRPRTQRPVRTGRADRRPLRRAPGRRGPLDVAARGVPGARGDRHHGRAPARDDHAAVRQRVPARRARREAGSLARPARTVDRAATARLRSPHPAGARDRGRGDHLPSGSNRRVDAPRRTVDQFDLYDAAVQAIRRPA